MSVSGRRGEVSGEVLATGPLVSRFLEVPIERLYGAHHQHLLQSPPERLDWDDYVALKEITAELAGSDERLVEIGGMVMKAPRMALGARALALIVDPGLLLLKASKNGWGRLFTNVDINCRREGDRIRIEVALHPGYRPCRPFFVQNAGILEYAPRLIGADDAEVEWTTDGYRGVYWARPPRSRTLWSLVKRRIAVLVNSQTTIQELTDQQDRLNRQNRELQSALHESQTALAARDRFLQTIDHELRTPLNGLRGAIEALRATPRCEEDERWLRVLGASEATLGHTIQSVLEYSHLESETLIPRAREFRPEQLARSLRDEAARHAHDPKLEVASTIPENVWLLADDERIQRVASELLKNAFAFGGDQPVSLGFELDETGSRARLRITVADRGIGIAEAEQARIFEPFVQLHLGEARSFGGQGLGLSIARAVCSALRGDLRVQSRPGAGATFTFEVPVEVARRAAPHAEPSARGRSVLLVDDDKINRMVGRRLLQKLGCTVTLAEDGLEALAKYDASSMDLVLMDCEMPNLDGWAATRQLRGERGAETPVVAVTAYTSEADRKRCFDAGMDDFIPKPLSEAALAAVLERWTDRGLTTSLPNPPAPKN